MLCLTKDFEWGFFTLSFPCTENLKEKIATAKEEQQAATTKIEQLESNLADAKGYRERQLKAAKDNMNKLKAASEKSTENWKKREQEADTLQLEIEELKKTIENAKTEAAAIEKKIEALQTKVRRRFYFVSPRLANKSLFA